MSASQRGRLDSLKHIVFLHYDKPQLDVWTRADAGWSQKTFAVGERALLDALDCELDVAALYRDPFAR